MAALKAPSKTLYVIVQGFVHKGVYAHAGFKIALTDAEAKYLLTGGNIALPEPEPVTVSEVAPSSVAA
jgi:hypothetical protein